MDPATVKETGDRSVPTTTSETTAKVESVSSRHLAPANKEERDVSEQTSVTGVDNEKQQPEPEAEAPPRDISGWRWIIVVLAILSSTFLFALDNTIVTDVQPVSDTRKHRVVEGFSRLRWSFKRVMIRTNEATGHRGTLRFCGKDLTAESRLPHWRHCYELNLGQDLRTV
jgi:hypothetical protein